MKPLLDSLLNRHWHHLPQEEVLDMLDTDKDKGLDRFEVEERQHSVFIFYHITALFFPSKWSRICIRSHFSGKNALF